MAVDQLSGIRPDPEDIVVQLQAFLSTRNAWKDLLTSGVGQTILEFVAAVGANDQYAIERVYKEMFPQTARLESSIYGITRLLGVRIKRKVGANVTCTFVNSGLTDISIPALTQFSLSAYKVYNKDGLTIPAGQTVSSILLYEGEIRSTTYSATGKDWQAIITAEDQFTVDDSTVVITVDSIEIPRTTRGLWTFKRPTVSDILEPNPAWQDLTTSDGRLQAQFGNDLYGEKPLSSSQIGISYAVTLGLQGNDASVAGLNITYTGQSSDLTITATVGGGGLQGGADQISANTYKNLSPRIFATQESASTRQDYEAIALDFPGSFQVIDAKFLAQRDLDTGDNTYMNLCKVFLLYQGSPISDTQFEEFTTWLTERSLYALRYFYDGTLEPTFGLARPANIDFVVDANVSCKNFSDLNEVKLAIESALTSFFEWNSQTISRDIYKSDIINTIKNSHDAIDFVVLNSPTADVITNAATINPSATTEVDLASTLTLNTSYTYQVTARFNSPYPNPDMETKPVQKVNILTPNIGGPYSVVLTWTELTGATDYVVYGRTGGNLQQLAIVTGNTFTDDGSIAPSGTPPVLDVTGVRYPNNTSITINTTYTYR